MRAQAWGVKLLKKHGRPKWRALKTQGLGQSITDEISRVRLSSTDIFSYALVASAASVASRTATTSQYLDYAASCRLKSIHYLKKKLADPDTFLNLESMEHINSACEAEIYAGNMDGARGHMLWLNQLCMKYLERQPLDRMMLLHLANDFYHDVQIAMITMQRMVFGVHNWMPNAIADALKLASQCLPSWMHDVSNKFNAAIDEDLHGLLLDRRKCSRLWMEKVNERILYPEMVYFHSLMTGGVHFGRILDRYLTYKAMVPSPERSITRIYLQQHLLLSILYWMYVCGREVYLGDRLLFDGTSLLFQQLRHSLEAASTQLTPEECTKEYNATKLYAMYTGAFYEQRQRLRHPKAAKSNWFNEHLAVYARTTGFHTWPAIEATVETFLYYPSLAPRGDTWFEKAINIYGSGAEIEVLVKQEDDHYTDSKL